MCNDGDLNGSLLTDRIISPIVCAFALTSIVVFLSLPKLRSSKLPQLLCCVFVGQLITGASGMFVFAANGYENEAFCTNDGWLCVASAIIGVLGVLTSLVWNAVFALHVWLNLKFAAWVAQSSHTLRIAYHAIAWPLIVGVTLFLYLTRALGHRLDSITSCFVISVDHIGWYAAPLIGTIAASAFIGLVSMLLIMVELCRTSELPAALRFMVVLRTGAFVIVFVVFSVYIVAAYLLAFGHAYVRYTNAVYAVLTSIIWFCSQAVADAFAHRRDRAFSSFDQGDGAFTDRPFKEMSDYSDASQRSGSDYQKLASHRSITDALPIAIASATRPLGAASDADEAHMYNSRSSSVVSSFTTSWRDQVILTPNTTPAMRGSAPRA